MSEEPIGDFELFIKNLRVYFIISIGLGVILSGIGTFLPSDEIFIMGMLGLCMAIGIGAMDFIYRVRDKKQRENLK